MSSECPICRTRYDDSVQTCPLDGSPLQNTVVDLGKNLVNGRYRPVERLGYGGMSSVYLVSQEPIGRLYAMKILSAALAREPSQRNRFFREANLVSQIEHPHVVRIEEVGHTEDHRPYILMELMRGPTLTEVLKKGALTVSTCVELATQLASALARAHALGIVHRDVKPDNAMYCIPPREGAVPCLKLLDFGLAWVRGGQPLTGTGQLFGTPEYISPEQVDGKPPSMSSDLYSLGVVLYEMLTGAVPFEGSPQDVMLAHSRQAPLPPSRRAEPSAIPARLERLVMNLLEKDPAFRYRDAHHLLEDLARLRKEIGVHAEESVAHDRRLFETPVRSYPPPTPSRAQRLHNTARRIENACAPLDPDQLPAWILSQNDRLRETAALAVQQEDALLAVCSKVDQLVHEQRRLRRTIGNTVDRLAAKISAHRRKLASLQQHEGALRLGAASAKLRGDDSSAPPYDHEALHRELEELTLVLEDSKRQLSASRGRLAAAASQWEWDSALALKDIAERGNRLDELLSEGEHYAKRISSFLVTFGKALKKL